MAADRTAKLTRRSAIQLTGAAMALPAAQFPPTYLENGPMPFTPKFVDLVRNFTTVQGTGPVVLGAAVSGYTSLADALITGDQFYYCIQGVDKPQEREVGRGTLQADGRIARLAVSGGLTNFSSGTKTIALVAAAEWFTKFEDAGSTSLLAVASRSELAARPGGRAFLAEPGREGNFEFDSSNLSAKVAADPAQGVYVAPSSQPTGASGAWVRKFSGAANVRWFGAVGDGVAGDGAAFVAAIAYLKSIAINTSQNGFYKASPRLLIPAGDYNLGTTTLDITHTFIIEGEGQAHNGPALASTLRWANNTTGIRIQAHNTSGASTVDGATHFAGQGFIIRNVALLGGYTNTEGEYHGIHAKARFTAEHVLVSGFPGAGVHIDATSLSGGADEGNANLFRLQNCALIGNRDGIFTKGGDANAGSIIACDFSYNRRWGVNEQSFLGNTYVACHSDGNGMVAALPSVVSYNGIRYAVKDGQDAGASTHAPSGTSADNTWWYYWAVGGVDTSIGIPAWSSGMTVRAGGPYRTTNINGQNVFLGCYSEGSSGPSQYVHPTIVIGGLHAAGVKGTASYLRNLTGVLSVSPGLGAIASDGVTANVVSPTSVDFCHPTGGNRQLQWHNGDLALTTLNSSEGSVWAYKITGEATASPLGSRKMDFPNGFGLAGKKILSATAAPTSGTHVQGDMMFNSAPTAGGPMGWMCVAGGSPGTWKAMANLAP